MEQLGNADQLYCIILTLISFSLKSAHHPVPVVDLSLFRDRVFAFTNLSVILLNIAFSLVLLSIILFLQDISKWSALRIGIEIAPGPAMIFLFALLGQRLAQRLSVRTVAAIGLILASVGRP